MSLKIPSFEGKLFLINFNDYFVENMHSKIHAHTSTNSSTDNIIKQAYLIGMPIILFIFIYIKIFYKFNNFTDERNHNELKDTFQRSNEYPYKPSSLKLLSEKTSLFLLNYFQEIYKNQGKGTLHKKRKKVEYKLATLGETVDSRCLPTDIVPANPHHKILVIIVIKNLIMVKY